MGENICKLFPGASTVKNPPVNAGDESSAPGSGRVSGGGQGNLLAVFLPGESHRQRSLMGYSPRGRKELDTTEAAEHPRRHTHI